MRKYIVIIKTPMDTFVAFITSNPSGDLRKAADIFNDRGMMVFVTPVTAIEEDGILNHMINSIGSGLPYFRDDDSRFSRAVGAAIEYSFIKNGLRFA